MSIISKTILVLIAAILAANSIFAGQVSKPRVFNLNGDLLHLSKLKLQQGDSNLQDLVANLEKSAEKALETEPLSVVTKQMTPPSGDKHDFMSIGPYWWPNPDTKDGLPYIRKDGQANPQYWIFGDYENLQTLSKAVRSLSLAYYFTERDEFAKHASILIRHWFIHPETRMNPNLNYGQSVPGVAEGRCFGIIDTRGFLAIVDGIGLIANSSFWTQDDQEAMQDWFTQYFKWLQESKLGIEESKTTNNHGTYYDVQVVTYALFTNQKQKAAEIIEKMSKQRAISQISKDGSQPRELARTQSWSYSNMNLKGFFMLVNLARQVDIDLANFAAEGRKPLKQALDYFIPYFKEEKKWEHQQLSPLQYGESCYLLRMGYIYYKNPEYKGLLKMISGKQSINESDLLWPLVESHQN